MTALTEAFDVAKQALSQLLSRSRASVQKEGAAPLQLPLVLMWHYKELPDVTLEV